MTADWPPLPTPEMAALLEKLDRIIELLESINTSLPND